VKDATEKEYARRQAEVRKPPQDYGAEIEEFCANTSEMGGRLARVEGMIKKLMQSLR
jgi:hypothetical protein